LGDAEVVANGTFFMRQEISRYQFPPVTVEWFREWSSHVGDRLRLGREGTNPEFFSYLLNFAEFVII
jgi:hypothetical protein